MKYEEKHPNCEAALLTLIREHRQVAQQYILLVYNGGRVDSVASADAHLERLTEVQRLQRAAKLRFQQCFQGGTGHGCFRRSLDEYINLVEQEPVVE